VGGLAVLLMILRALKTLWRERKIRRMGNNAAAVAYFSKITKYIYHFNLKLADHETPLQFGKRTSKHLLLTFENGTVNMQDIAHILYRAKYAPNPITTAERNTMQNALSTLQSRLKEAIGLPRYLVYKYIKISLG
jgi:hypothetical protein